MVTVGSQTGAVPEGEPRGADGRGWSVLDGGRSRAVAAMELRGGDRIVLRHEACTGPPDRREVAYCLHGEQLGRGNAVTDDWGARGRPPHGLDALAVRFSVAGHAPACAVRD